MSFDPETYTITIRKENVDGDIYFVGRVAEFSNISAFEDTFEDARSSVIDAINTLKMIADQDGVAVPGPTPSSEIEYSGRVTLRLPKTLHARLDHLAKAEDVSLNQIMITGLATYVGEADGLSRAATVVADTVINAAKNAFYFFASGISVSKPTPPSTGNLPNLSYALITSSIEAR
jgi:predicted RNase H-like HicB family nuclease